MAGASLLQSEKTHATAAPQAGCILRSADFLLPVQGLCGEMRARSPLAATIWTDAMSVRWLVAKN
jgi:hypothetical protein